MKFSIQQMISISNVKVEFLPCTHQEELQLSVQMEHGTSGVPRLQGNVLKVPQVYLSFKL